MSDAKTTQNCYVDVCKEGKVSVNLEIVYLLEQLHEENDDDPKIECSLILNGNKRNEKNEMYRKRLQDQDILILYKTLRENTFIVGLDLSYNCIGDEGASYLKDLLTDTLVLNTLNISYNEIGIKGGIEIAKGIQMNETLKSINMDGNKICNKGGLALVNTLQSNTALTALSINACDLTAETVIALCTVLNFNKTLECVNINRPLLFSVQEETTIHLANMFKRNSTLERIQLASHDIGNDGIERIAVSLMNNASLTYLDLSCNKISRDGAAVIAKLLIENTPLEYLNLSANRIEDDGAISISKAVSRLNTNLQTLIICSNSIGGTGLKAVIDAMHVNATLRRLFVWGNQFTPVVCEAFKILQEEPSPRFHQDDIDVQVYTVDGKANLAYVQCKYR